MKTKTDVAARWLPSHEFYAIYGKVPRLGVDLVVRTPRGIVLTKRSTYPCTGQWHIPGGTVLFGERLEDALHRIAMGELGIEIEVGRHLGFIEYVKLAESGYPGWPIAAAFEVTIAGGKLQGSFQGREIGFFAEVPDNMIEDQADFIRATGVV